MEGKGERGRAISVEALKYIWPDVPLELLDLPKVARNYPLYAFFVGLLLGIPTQNFIKPIVCSLKQDLSFCEHQILVKPENPFSIRLIINDNLTIEEVALELSLIHI